MEKPLVSLSISSHFRHAGPDPASRRCPDDSREPFQRLGPGFHREPWILVFAGMTIQIEAAISKKTLINFQEVSKDEIRRP